MLTFIYFSYINVETQLLQLSVYRLVCRNLQQSYVTNKWLEMTIETGIYYFIEDIPMFNFLPFSIIHEYYYRHTERDRRPTEWRVAVANDFVWRSSLDGEQLRRTQNTAGRLLARPTGYVVLL